MAFDLGDLLPSHPNLKKESFTHCLWCGRVYGNSRMDTGSFPGGTADAGMYGEETITNASPFCSAKCKIEATKHFGELKASRPSAKTSGWRCSLCGQDSLNTANYCIECGIPKEDEGWECCKNLNKGNYCPTCGSSRH